MSDVHQDCEHDDSFGEQLDCLERQALALDEPGLLARVDQLKAHVAARRRDALFGDTPSE